MYFLLDMVALPMGIFHSSRINPRLDPHILPPPRSMAPQRRLRHVILRHRLDHFLRRRNFLTMHPYPTDIRTTRTWYLHRSNTVLVICLCRRNRIGPDDLYIADEDAVGRKVT